MGHVLSFTHCKDAPSTTSSTPDSCPPDEVHTPDSSHPAPADQYDVDDTAVTLADLWPLPSPQEPTFSYITIGSSIPIARPPARGRRGRGLGRGQGTRNEEPGEDIVSFVLLEKVCHMTQALPPLIGHEEMTFMERPQPRLDLHQTQPRLDLHQTQPRLDLHQLQPRPDLHQPQPRLDLHQTQPRPNLHQTQPRPNLHQPQPRPDLHTVVMDLLYWKDVALSAACLTGVTVSLLCLIQFSVISVLSYAALILLCGSLTIRTYSALLNAMKRGDGVHPFQRYLDAEPLLPPAQVEAVAARLAVLFSSALSTLRGLFLVKETKESLKFLVLLYLLTYVGAVLNGLTLLVLGVIGLFTFPVIYKHNQVLVDRYVSMVSSRVSAFRAKFRAQLKKQGTKKD